MSNTSASSASVPGAKPLLGLIIFGLIVGFVGLVAVVNAEDDAGAGFVGAIFIGLGSTMWSIGVIAWGVRKGMLSTQRA